MNIKPQAIKPGDTIGVFTPSSRTEEKEIQGALELLHGKGFKTHVHPQTYYALNQSAGTPEEKTAAFHELLENDEVGAIFCARGGNRTATMLPLIDFDKVKTHPKILLGYSDVTALLNAVYARAGLISFHGPVLKIMATSDENDIAQLFDLLGGAATQYDFSGAEIQKTGECEGRLVGGNLSLIQAMIGTVYMPPLKDAILFIEDTGDQLSRYDRMLTQLRLSGALHDISALIVGQIDCADDTSSRPFGFTLADIIEEHTRGLDIPVVVNAPFGHSKRLCTFPVGANAKLSATGKRPNLELSENAVC